MKTSEQGEFLSQASPDLIEALRETVRNEGRNFQEVLDDAVSSYVASKRSFFTKRPRCTSRTDLTRISSLASSWLSRYARLPGCPDGLLNRHTARPQLFTPERRKPSPRNRLRRFCVCTA